MTLPKCISWLLTPYFLLVAVPLSDGENDPPNPHIWLSDYTVSSFLSGHRSNYGRRHIRPEEYNGFRYAPEFDSEYISKSNDSAYTISTQVQAVVFSCQSSDSVLPVLWKKSSQANIPIHSLVSEFLTFPYRDSNFTADMKGHPENKVFRSDLSFRIFPGYRENRRFNFTVTCFSSTDPEVNSTLVVNIKDQHDGSNHPNGYPEYQATEEIDDPPNHGDDEVMLSQKLEEVTPRFVLKGNSSLVLSPSNASLYSSFVDLTCCSGGANEVLEMEAHLCEEEGFGCDKKTMSKWFQSFEQNYKRSLDRGRTTTTAIPELVTKNIGDKPTQTGGGNTCMSHMVAMMPSIFVLCKSDNIDVAQEYVVTFKSADDKKGPKWSPYTFTPTSELGNLKVEHKIFMALGKRPSIKGESEDMSYNYYGRNLVTAKASIFSSVLQEGGVNADHTLKEISPGIELAEGESVQVICVFLRHFYADGGRFRLNWKNGTKTVLKADHDPSLEIRFLSGFRADDGRSLLRRVVGRTINAHSEIESVECFAPHMKGIGWDSRSLPLNSVRAVIPPSFSEPAMEIIATSLNQTRVEFSCEVHQFPVTDISIFRNNGDDSSIENWAAVTIKTDKKRASAPEYIVKTTVTFDFVTEEVFGEYICFTENFRGQTASRTVKLVGKEV